MYKNALKEDLIRVVEDLDGTVESSDTIAKLKTKIEKSSTFESDPDFVKTLIKNCIDERVSRNERDLEKQKIELAKTTVSKIRKEVELQTAKNKALSLNPAAKVEEKQFETLNKETATHIGIREAEDWFRPIDLAKECDIYISSKNGSHSPLVSMDVPLRTAYSQAGRLWQPKPVFARRRSKSKTKTCELLREEKRTTEGGTHLIEDEIFKDIDIINNMIDYEDGQEEPDSSRVDKIMQGSSFPTN
ncbi:hypothetical protein TNCV_1670421 [Trichonephila clavipes]|nr:hypothetical protein TNCV_1670421 [Trichonephila clavipes]